tara:strand:- start:329 stop:1057 length:729 start_codon:yes stop_codon:yes gene_type:complete
MYAKKNKPMYGKGGAIKYQNGGQGPDLFGIDAVLEAREKAKNDPNYDPLGLKELVPAAKERISNQMKEAGDSFEEKREAVLNYLVDLFNPSSEKKMMKGGMMPKYPGGGMMPRKRGMMMYQEGGEMSREPKVDIIDNKILVGGSMIKKQKPGGGFEYVPKPEYANEAMFYVDGVPATFADAKFAFEQTSDAGVGLDFNDYIEKYTKQRGAYDLDLKKQRESLGERAEAAGTPALLRALRDMR